MFDLLADPNAWAALLTLTALEIVLGIDNIVFLSVLIARLEPAKAEQARKIGLSLALIFRVAFLFALTTLMALREPLFTVFGMAISWRDLILIGGGAFLLVKATLEIHGEIEGLHGGEGAAPRVASAFSLIILQIVVVDLVFSIDSIITAIGMVEQVEIMIVAVVIAIGVMYVASGPVGEFIKRHPTTKMLALAFLLMIGMMLVADGFDVHIPRGYVYAAMGFAVLVETLNVLARRKEPGNPDGH
jgi:predicted tellurium resistance membrane protein TerC